jgi:hypothetical protein
MKVQKRALTGIKFEKERCESNGWQRLGRSPRIQWDVDGCNIWNKIRNTNANPKKFSIDYDNSILEKYDAITPEGERVEIKAVTLQQLENWTLFAEPFPSVKTWSSIYECISIFGTTKDYSHLNRYNVKKYKRGLKRILKNGPVDGFNKFLDGLYDNASDEIISRIKSKLDGIECYDGYVPIEDIEFRWVVGKGWKGFNRVYLTFRIKNKRTIPFTMDSKLYKLIDGIEDKNSFLEGLIENHFAKVENLELA